MRINQLNRRRLSLLTLIIIIFSASSAMPAQSRQTVATALNATQNPWFSSLTGKFNLTAVQPNIPAFEPPKPDFSAMEKWYEIVRYEYPEAPERNMTILIKPKVDFKQRMMAFKMEFLDRDGVLVGSDAAWICCSTQLGDTETGKIGKVTVQVPSEREIDRVISAKVIRIKDNY